MEDEGGVDPTEEKGGVVLEASRLSSLTFNASYSESVMIGEPFVW